jgi:hypothetical protein
MSVSTDPTLQLPTDPNAPVLFDRGPLSNFHQSPTLLPCPYTGTLREFATTEHYFQAAKAAAYFKALNDLRGYLQIALAPTAATAKRLARKVPLSPEALAAWNHGGSFAAMLAACQAKFRQHRDLREYLVATGTRLLIEHRPDPIWGDNLNGTGRNLLGLVLMIVRAEFL